MIGEQSVTTIEEAEAKAEPQFLNHTNKDNLHCEDTVSPTKFLDERPGSKFTDLIPQSLAHV